MWKPCRNNPKYNCLAVNGIALFTVSLFVRLAKFWGSPLARSSLFCIDKRHGIMYNKIVIMRFLRKEGL